MGPLKGVRVVEFAGIGPGPFACMMLADMGAEILRIDRKGAAAGPGDPTRDFTARGRRSVAMDLKAEGAAEAALGLIARADILVEGFRPGVMERLGLGPEPAHAANPALVYGRMTGWGQDGPLSRAAGHDINYISLSGALWSMGEADRKPAPPLNLLGDFGAGGMMLAFGAVSALYRARETGRGDVVDAAICDGVAALMAPIYAQMAMGAWRNRRQANRLDGAAPYYGVYECADGKWISIAPLEPQFHALLLELLGLPEDHFGDRLDPAGWPEGRDELARIFAQRTREEWVELMEGTDVCFAPVLDLEEAPAHPHNRARGVFRQNGGAAEPTPAPRFAAARPETPGPPPRPGGDTDAALGDWGLSGAEIDALRGAGVL